MKYHIETISVWEAYEADCECPLCAIKAKMDQSYIESYLGDAAMLPEIRVEVNKKGFCGEHLLGMYNQRARLPLALQLHTYLKTKNEKDAKLLRSYSILTANSGKFFKPSIKKDAVKQLLDKLEHDERSCIICEHIANNMLRYIDTIFHLYKTDSKFKKLFKEGKGYCMPHFRQLLERSSSNLSKKDQTDFIPDLIRIQLENQKRLEDEIEWFTKKFDYQHKDKPWGNSRDAVPRVINKLKGDTIAIEQLKSES